MKKLVHTFGLKTVKQRSNTIRTSLVVKLKTHSWLTELKCLKDMKENTSMQNCILINEMELETGRSIFVIGVEGIIVHRLESAMVSQPENPEWTDDFEWAKRMFEIHKSDSEIMDLAYLKLASIDAQVDNIIKNWLKQ